MSGRFVRASKYRHVFGRPTRKEQCYDNLRISKNAWDTNLVKANPKYLSVNWEASGGGAFAVIPLNEKGKALDQIPLFRGHTAAVLDTDWSPFNDSLIASGSDDGKVMLWKVPEGFTIYNDGEDVEDVKPFSKLSGHSRKVGHLLFNPSAENVLASSSGDCTVKLWDIESGSSHLTLKHGDIVQSLSWSANGSLLVTTCRDKKLRVWDVRQQKPAVETAGHSGAKNSRSVWMGEHDRVATTGFSKMSDRQLGLWDIRNAREPMDGFQILDSISGVCMPFWDDGTQCLYLAGKGDGNIRYFEYVHDKFEYLSEYKSPEPQRGLAFLPKRGVNTHENEVMRAFKTINDTYVEPISFIVPRRAEAFQGDIYPPAVGLKPSMSAAEWLDGKEGMPPKIDLESLFDGEEAKEVPADYRPATPMQSQTPNEAHTPTKTGPASPAPVDVAAASSRVAPSSMKASSSSLATAAARYDNEEDSSSEDEETSSFEEVSKPVERPTATTAAVASQPASKVLEAPPSTNKMPLDSLSKQTNQSSELSQGSEARSVSAASTIAPSPAISGPTDQGHARSTSTAAEGLRGHLSDIKSMLELHNKKLDALTDEVAGLKTTSSEKDERIKALEKELESLRSG